jgi:L-seryl-tRNA(Ser) seleniumtransferase
VAALKREPFFRALRCDKLILSALQATVDLYLRNEAPEGIPVLGMLRLSAAALTARAEQLVAALDGIPLEATVGAGKAQIGGGTLPRSIIPSVTLDLVPRAITLRELAARLRAQTPPVVGYIASGRFKLDLRTIFPAQDEAMLRAVRAAVQ